VIRFLACAERSVVRTCWLSSWLRFGAWSSLH